MRTRPARCPRQAVNICTWASNSSGINKHAQFYRLHFPNDVFNAGWFTLYCSGFMVGSKQFILPTNKLNIPKIKGRWLGVCRIWIILDAKIGTQTGLWDKDFRGFPQALVTNVVLLLWNRSWASSSAILSFIISKHPTIRSYITSTIKTRHQIMKTLISS